MKALREKGTRAREKLLNKPRTKVFQGTSLGQMAVKSRGMSVGLNCATRTIQIQVQVWKPKCSAVRVGIPLKQLNVERKKAAV